MSVIDWWLKNRDHVWLFDDKIFFDNDHYKLDYLQQTEEPIEKLKCMAAKKAKIGGKYLNKIDFI